MRRYYTGLITKLDQHQIFVFGSNTQGRHGKGAALWALQHAGAIYGDPRGLQGKSYAIVTKDLTKSVHPSISRLDIENEIAELYNHAFANPDIEYLVSYSGTHPNLNGYSPQQMASMFRGALKFCKPHIQVIPENIVFEQSFFNLVFIPQSISVNISNQ